MSVAIHSFLLEETRRLLDPHLNSFTNRKRKNNLEKDFAR